MKKRREAKSTQKTAIVVGASSGIGKETALLLSAQGADVYGISRRPVGAERVHAQTADASKEGELAKAIGEICEKTGGLDILVYSAGYDFLAPVQRAESERMRYLFEVNFFGAAEALSAAAPYLQARGGRVLLIGSMAGEVVVPYNAFYCASKAALSMLARTADAELKKTGVRVSALLPGGTATEFTYRRKVCGEKTCGESFAAVRRVEAALAHEEQGGMQPERVAEAAVKLLARGNPPATAAAGAKNKFVRAALRLLPARVTDGAARRKFAGKD